MVCDQVLHPSYCLPRLRLGVIHALIMQRQGYTQDARVAEGQRLKQAFQFSHSDGGFICSGCQRPGPHWQRHCKGLARDADMRSDRADR